MSVKFPKKALDYGEVRYWEARYEKEREENGGSYNFDWYCNLSDFWPLVENYYAAEEENEAMNIKEISRVLVIGCGNSSVSEGLVKKVGLRNVLSIDWSKTVISFANARYEHIEALEFALMDTRKLDRLPTNSFDLIIEKACLDALFCTPESYKEVLQANTEIHRVLKPNGKFISISLGSPPMRMPHYAHISLDWRVDHTLIPNKTGVHLYACTKLSNDEARPRRSSVLAKGENVHLGEVLDTENPEWDKRKLQPSMNHLKDKWTPGNLRLQRIRDADIILTAIRAMSSGLPVIEQGAALKEMPLNQESSCENAAETTTTTLAPSRVTKSDSIISASSSSSSTAENEQ